MVVKNGVEVYSIFGKQSGAGMLPVLVDSTGAIIVSTTGPNAFTFGPDNADSEAVNTTNLDLIVKARLQGFDGTNWDRLRTGIFGFNNTGTQILNALLTVARVTGSTTLSSTLASAAAMTDANSGEQTLAVSLMGWNTATFDRIQSGYTNFNAARTGVLNALLTMARSAGSGTSTVNTLVAATGIGDGNAGEQFGVTALSGMVSGSTWSRYRIPNVFKTATATASGDTAVWTPATGKAFRLLGYLIEVTANAATSGGAVIDILLRDATTATGIGHSVFVPSAAGTTFTQDYSTGCVLLGPLGIRSAAANNVLNVNLSAALTAGNVRVVAFGVEE